MSLWCSPANMPASHAGDHRSEAGQGRKFQLPPKHCQRCIRSVSDLARCNSGWGLRSRASAQVGFISPHRPGRHRRLRPAFAKASAWRAIWPLRRSSQRIEIPPMGSTASVAISISGEWLSGKSRPHRSRICEPWRCKSSLAHQFCGVEATADRHRTFNPVG